ncbi:hypothetical protein Tco_0751005 [Tanacetum coccineum]|uniref:Uncharacterized protein n=1 Tax=Tanacetum coccineum TaxID=301880 RepID=A0ABQ4Z2V5_9ASTR
MSSSSSTSNWIRPYSHHAFVSILVVERLQRTPAKSQLGESGSQCRFYHFLDPEIRYGYYRNEMHNLYVQLQQARREMQVQEYTYRSRIHELELELNERTVTGDCYKKAVVVFIMVVFVMEPLSASFFSDSLLLIHSYQQVAAISASVISAPIICQMLDPAAHLDLLNLGSTKLDLHALGSADATRINKA